MQGQCSRLAGPVRPVSGHARRGGRGDRPGGSLDLEKLHGRLVFLVSPTVNPGDRADAGARLGQIGRAR